MMIKYQNILYEYKYIRIITRIDKDKRTIILGMVQDLKLCWNILYYFYYFFFIIFVSKVLNRNSNLFINYRD